MAELDALLDRCLAARAEGQSLEECLRGLDPDLRQELRPMLLLAEALRQAPRPALSAGAAAAQERALLAQAARLRPPPARPRAQPWNPFAILRSWRLGLVPALTLFFLAASLVLIGGAGAMVSSARPDDALYSFKLSWEQAQLLVATNDTQRARVYLQIAQNRLDEIERLGRDGQPIPAEQLLQLKLAANQVIALTATLPAHDAIPILRELSALLNYENILLTRFLATLPPPERATVELALQDTEASRIAVTRTLQDRIDQQVPNPPSPSPSPPTPSTSDPTPPSERVSPAAQSIGQTAPDALTRPDDAASLTPAPLATTDAAPSSSASTSEPPATGGSPSSPQPVIRLRKPSPTELPPQPIPPEPRGHSTDEGRAEHTGQSSVTNPPDPPGRGGQTIPSGDDGDGPQAGAPPSPDSAPPHTERTTSPDHRNDTADRSGAAPSARNTSGSDPGGATSGGRGIVRTTPPSADGMAVTGAPSDNAQRGGSERSGNRGRSQGGQDGNSGQNTRRRD